MYKPSAGFRTVVLLLALAICPAGLFGEGEVGYPITWDPVDGAGGYQVEVQNDRQAVVVSQTVTANTITLKLFPGLYSFRLTTLNRFMRSEAVTAWLKFHVLAPAPPVFVGIEPAKVEWGTPQTVTLTVDNFSREGQLIVQSPAGIDIAVPATRLTQTTIRLQLPALQELGAYTLVLTNPPDQSLKLESAFSLHFPRPIINALQPDSFPSDQIPETLSINGSKFLPQTAVSLSVDGKELGLAVVSNSNETLVVGLPKTLKPGDYQLTVATGTDADSLAIAQLHIGPGQPLVKTLDRDLMITAGWNYTGLLNRWDRYYGPSAAAAGLGVEYYFTPNRLPINGAAINVGARLATLFTHFSTKPDSLQRYTASEMSILSFYLAPSIELAFPFMMLRLYVGGGLAYSAIKGSDNLGNSLAQDSWDWLAISRLALDVPLADFLRLEVAAETRVYFMTETMASLTIEAGVAFTLPVY